MYLQKLSNIEHHNQCTTYVIELCILGPPYAMAKGHDPNIMKAILWEIEFKICSHVPSSVV